MVIPSGGCWGWPYGRTAFRRHAPQRESSSAYFGVPTARVVDVGLEVEI